MNDWKKRAKQLKTEVYALHLALQDRRVAWGARAFIALVIAYALSPIDLIPDFIPVLGYLDDLILLPLGILIAIAMIPAEVMEDCRKQAHEALGQSSAGAALVILLWCVAAAAVILVLFK